MQLLVTKQICSFAFVFLLDRWLELLSVLLCSNSGLCPAFRQTRSQWSTRYSPLCPYCDARSKQRSKPNHYHAQVELVRARPQKPFSEVLWLSSAAPPPRVLVRPAWMQPSAHSEMICLGLSRCPNCEYNDSRTVENIEFVTRIMAMMEALSIPEAIELSLIVTNRKRELSSYVCWIAKLCEVAAKLTGFEYIQKPSKCLGITNVLNMLHNYQHIKAEWLTMYMCNKRF